jgi:hypothetical protein
MEQRATDTTRATLITAHSVGVGARNAVPMALCNAEEEAERHDRDECVTPVATRSDEPRGPAYRRRVSIATPAGDDTVTNRAGGSGRAIVSLAGS